MTIESSSLELTSRKGHSLTNGLVAALALEAGAPLVLNSDAHSPEDLLPPAVREKVASGAGLPNGILKKLQKQAAGIVEDKKI